MTEPGTRRTPVASSGSHATAEDSGRWTSPVIGIGLSAMSTRPRLRFIVRVGELVAGVAFVLVSEPSKSSHHALTLASALLGGLAWLAWILCTGHRRRALAALSALAAIGGVCVATSPTAGLLVFVPVAATAFSFSAPVAVAVCGPAVAGFLVTGLATGSLPANAWSLVECALLGFALGIARGQLLQRGREATLLAIARRDAALADREAQLVNERNRLGRELHDVLAHTLGAVSIQLTALDSRLVAGDSAELLRARVSGVHELVGEGLREARDAVRALHGDTLSLDPQIERLCALHHAALHVEGRSRPLRAEDALALYRAVQEALTNAAKHAPEAPITVAVAYAQAQVVVTVDNGPGSGDAGRLAETGGGHGLQGMRTRVRLVGGDCAAGPHGDGWRVTATVPYGASSPRVDGSPGA